MGTPIAGAGDWEQSLYDHLAGHADAERAALEAYVETAESVPSESFRYLVDLILDDERRHHALLKAMAETLRTSGASSGRPTPIPPMETLGASRDAVLGATERLLDIEYDDRRDLDALARRLRPMAGTTMWELVVELLQRDNDKHIRILEFVRDHARRAE
jgi:rubrerythrin